MSNQQEIKFRFEPLDKAKHNRAAFSCEHEALNTYLQQRANQDIKNRVAAVNVLTPDGEQIAGYYTLSQYVIKTDELPAEVVQKLKLPKYNELPATLLGRLARSLEFKGLGLGEILVVGALRQAFEHSKHVASMAVVVDSKDIKSTAYYRRYGFIDLPDNPHRLFLPMRTIGEIFR